MDNVSTPARLEKPFTILAFGNVITSRLIKLDGCRGVQNCDTLQRSDVQLVSIASMQNCEHSRDIMHTCMIVTQTGNERLIERLYHETVLVSAYHPKMLGQMSIECLSAGLMLASATFSAPATLLIRTRLAAISACNQRNRTSR